MRYLWTQGVVMAHLPCLDGNITTDVLVIGGGMAGMLCAYLLQQKGVNCVLVEANRIGTGITKGTTAVLTAQHDTLYTDLSARFGGEKAHQYLHANLQAVEKFRTLSHTIACDFEDKPSIQFSLTDREVLEREALTVCNLGFSAEFTTQTALPLRVAGAVRYPGMAQFHPLKFLAGIAPTLKIYENTKVFRLDGTTAYTNNGKITAKKVIVATHFPFINSHGLYFMKLYQKRSFVLALENAPDLESTLVDTAENGMYFRNFKDLLLIGGGDHRTGAQGGGFEAVRAFAKHTFPQAKEKSAWATQDCMSLDGVPYIGAYSAATPNLYVATGFNEWGMTSSMVAATILADQITGQQNACAPVFAPDRTVLHKQLFVNMGTTLGDFLLPTTKRCSHLGCALKWNRAERTWDCPCHGSRFNEKGGLIDNPAMGKSHVE